MEENKPQPRKPKWKDEDYKAQLIKIPEGAVEFYAPKADKWFRVIQPTKLSVDRLEVFEEKVYEFAMVKNYEEIIEDITKIYENSVDGTKHADNRVLSFNLLWGMRNLHARSKFAMKLCSVFIIGEDDEEEEYRETEAQKNIKIWKKEFENDFFLQCAANTVGGYKPLAALILRAFLGKEVMEHYLSQREEILKQLIDLGQQKAL